MIKEIRDITSFTVTKEVYDSLLEHLNGFIDEIEVYDVAEMKSGRHKIYFKNLTGIQENWIKLLIENFSE